MRKLLIALVCLAALLDAQGLSKRRAPSFSLPDATLAQHDILDYRGSWLLVDFMQTNCPHCKALSKTLESVKARYGKKVVILSIVLPPDNTKTVNQYIAENKVTAPIVFDSGQVAAAWFKATPEHPSFDTPHLFAVDPQGMIQRDWSQPALETGVFEKDLEQLLSGKK